MALPEKGGNISFNVPSAGRECYTWFKISGDLSTGKTPVIIVHGGPGGCHKYVLSFTELAKSFDIPTILYGQIGNGKSTRLSEKKGDDSFSTKKLFVDELENLVRSLGLHKRGFDVLGYSWGSMIGSVYACTQPPGLRRVIIANSLGNARDWEEAAWRLVKAFPDNVREIIQKADLTDESEEYKKAITVFRSRFFAKLRRGRRQKSSCCLIGSKTTLRSTGH